MGTCMYHIRGGMGSGETYTRPDEQQSGEEEDRDLIKHLQKDVRLELYVFNRTCPFLARR